MTKNSDSSSMKFNRLMLRSAFQSLFWAVIVDRKRKTGLTLTTLADKIGVDKSYISRSFSSPPNWQIDKISDMADALGIELELRATDISSGEIFSSTGKLKFAESFSVDSDCYKQIERSEKNVVTATDRRGCVVSSA